MNCQTIFCTHTTLFFIEKNIIKTLENLNERPIKTAVIVTLNKTIMELKLLNITENISAANLS